MKRVYPLNIFGLSIISCGLAAKSCLTLVTPKTIARQAPLSMGFPRQEFWSGLPCPQPGDLPNPGIKPVPPASPVLAGMLFTTSATCKAPVIYIQC